MANAGTRTREIANVLAIITGVALIGLSMWGASGSGVYETRETTAEGVPWFTHFFAGAITLGGVFTSQKWSGRRIGQLCFVVAAALLLGSLVVFRFFGAWALLTLLLPGLLLLAVTPMMGPMPRPQT